MSSNFQSYLLDLTKSSKAQEAAVIQSLWSGYGKISRYKLSGSTLDTVVVKHIAPNASKGHPRGWSTDRSHKRKEKSYEVETFWYQNWSGKCSDKCRIPKFLGAYVKDDERWIVMEDLNFGFPVRKEEAGLDEVKLCLGWLANFHARFLNNEPTGLWKLGTYWHLETRPDEWEKIEYQQLKEKALKIDEALNKCKHQTLVHGDAKLANFCFSNDAKKVAAVDFQYVGGGCGMKDVAYFLGSCLGSKELEYYEESLLSFYFTELKAELDISNYKVNAGALEMEWRRLYPFACVDFVRFLSGWMPNHPKINKYNRRKIELVLGQL